MSQYVTVFYDIINFFRFFYFSPLWGFSFPCEISWGFSSFLYHLYPGIIDYFLLFRELKGSDSGTYTCRVDFTQVNITGTYTCRVDFTQVNITGTYTCRVDFTQANITGTYTCRVDFTQVNITGTYTCRDDFTQINITVTYTWI